jgi:RNA recognition motif-containing protein
LDQQGQFRGLAFANFRQSVDADAVVAALNGFDVQGRKLRVEYKKVLQAGEKERIEREKAIRRMRSMQLEKEQQTTVVPQKNTYEDYGNPIAYSQRSFSSGSPFQPNSQYSPPLASMPTPTFSMPMPVPVAPTQIPPTASSSAADKAFGELDLNDPSTLEIYSRILLFKDDPMRDELAFSRTLTAKQRRIVHLIAQKLGVYHYSVGEGEDRYAVVTRIDPNRVSPSLACNVAPTLTILS